MKRLPFIAGLIGCLSLVSGCGVEKTKLQGTWIVEDGPSPVYDAEGKLTRGVPKGMTWEFTADGKLNWATQEGASLVAKEGLTWTVSGDFLIFKLDNKEGKARIKEITDSRLVLKDDEQPKEVVFRKLK